MDAAGSQTASSLVRTTSPNIELPHVSSAEQFESAQFPLDAPSALIGDTLVMIVP